MKCRLRYRGLVKRNIDYYSEKKMRERKKCVPKKILIWNRKRDKKNIVYSLKNRIFKMRHRYWLKFFTERKCQKEKKYLCEKIMDVFFAE